MRAQDDAGRRWRTSFPETPGIKKASRSGERGASCRIIQAQFRLPGDFHEPLQITPGIKEAGRISRAVSCAHRLRALTGSVSRELPLPNWVQFYCRGSFPGGRPHSLRPSPGALRSLPVGNRAESWKEEKACPQRRSRVSTFALSLACGLFLLAPARALEGWSATLGSQVPLEAVPRHPSGRLTILLLPDS